MGQEMQNKFANNEDERCKVAAQARLFCQLVTCWLYTAGMALLMPHRRLVLQLMCASPFVPSLSAGMRVQVGLQGLTGRDFVHQPYRSRKLEAMADDSGGCRDTSRHD